MSEPYAGPLLFCDTETTGLDPHATRAAMLEAAFIITEGPELEVRAEANLIIRPAGNSQDHDTLWASMEPVVREMHEANGLWHEATLGGSAWSTHDADDAIAAWLTEQGITSPIPLAGSGVERLDRPWINAFLPRVASRLTYWALDISPQRRTMQYAGRLDLIESEVEKSLAENRNHRALDDVRLYVDEARRYMRLYRSMPTPEVLARLDLHFNRETDPCAAHGRPGVTPEWPCAVAKVFDLQEVPA